MADLAMVSTETLRREVRRYTALMRVDPDNEAMRWWRQKRGSMKREIARREERARELAETLGAP